MIGGNSWLKGNGPGHFTVIRRFWVLHGGGFDIR
jgi:hypothetical protein